MPRRTGDAVAIGGDYQYKALTEGPAIQRFWHYSRQLSIRQYLPPEPGDQVVDVGCGSGTVSAFLGTFGAHVLGLDGNPDAVEFARRNFQKPNVTFEQALVDEALGSRVAADKIYCMEVIEHIYASQGEKMLTAFHTLLKPSGRVLLSTPNYRSAWPLIEWTMDKLRLTPRMQGDQHVELYHARKLGRLAERSGFVVERMWTCCLLAPWLAPLGWRLAERVHHLETAKPHRMGSILLCLLARSDAPGARRA
jgi:2-polyprenyl-3-methyl-5-hydroxy-6-metoxy-1,4-benzoquinol methylase